MKSAGLNKFRVVGQAKNGQLEIIVDGSTASVYSVKRQRQNVVRKGGICGNKMPSPSCASGRQRGGNVKSFIGLKVVGVQSEKNVSGRFVDVWTFRKGPIDRSEVRDVSGNDGWFICGICGRAEKG